MSQFNPSQRIFGRAARQLGSLLTPLFSVDEVTSANTKILIGVLKGNRAVLEGYVEAISELIDGIEKQRPKRPRSQKIDIK